MQNKARHDPPVKTDGINLITIRLTFLTQSVHLRPNFQGLPWFEIDGLVEDGFY